jgi:hypothetical protein
MTGPYAAQMIEALAREAGFHGPSANMLYTVRGNHAQLERFAALVRAAALEEAASEAEHWQKISRPDHKCGEYIADAIRAIAATKPESAP